MALFKVAEMETSSKKTENATSFRKKKANVSHIPGTKISFHNAQLLASTGVPSLDVFLGGGLAVGTAILIEEDSFHIYSNLLLKYFIAEGVTNGHSLFLASGDVPPEKILQELPAPASSDKKNFSPSSEDELKIAWRYQNQAPSSITSSTNHYYDLSKTMNEETLEKCHIRKWSPRKQTENTSKNSCFTEEPYHHLLQEIQNQIDKGDFHTSNSVTHRNILRIAISSMDSPMWHQDNHKNIESTIPRFLYGLRILLRSSFSVAMITVPKINCKNVKWFSRVKQMVDSAICLEPIMKASKDDNLMLKDFDGLLHIIKLPVLNSCVYQVPTADLAFKLKRKNFIVEKLHLPPDLGGPEPLQQVSGPVSCCSGPKASHLDF